MGHSCDEYVQSTWRKPGDMLAMVPGGDVLARRLAPCGSDSTVLVVEHVNGGGDSTICLAGMNELRNGALNTSLKIV